ncbi:MAG TPA: 1-deoxy-D-xylulose-5-phosphate synthase [Pseudomonadales bacterium]|nr:1-deoxy-D-xylulose-5-phosphate synthase [Pseudomonadales bacterium]
MTDIMFDAIPEQRPSTPLLDAINSPADLRALAKSQLPQVAKELREFLLFSVGQSGGHFGAGLGVVELTIALHYIFNTPDDRIVWDVGHQCYPHKILTGRREEMHTMRQMGGLAGFPKRGESEYDTFGVGHSSTSISAALGMALAARQQGIKRHCVAVIGDGAMTGGMAFEALAHAAHTRANLLVILNDNQMSISHNAGGLASYFAKIWASKFYTQIREGGKKVLSSTPSVRALARRTEEHIKGMVAPGTLFEELGFHYIGPIDGHNIEDLLYTIGNMHALEGPQLLHIQTRKGKGFKPAEADPIGYHALNKIAPKHSSAPKRPKFQDIFGQWLCDAADADPLLVGITPAMKEGSGMVEFADCFPERFFDVAIAEQHAVTLGAGMACDGSKPVVAIYSTFLQRGYDQLVHDVAIQNLDVTFAIDRAGLVGEDGPTHAGNFDLSYMRCIPNMIIATPSDECETRLLLQTAYEYKGPAAVRYPRGTGCGAQPRLSLDTVDIGRAVHVHQGDKKLAILAFGTLLHHCFSAAEQHGADIFDMRWVKPLDTDLIDRLASEGYTLITVEENAIMGGAGSAVSEYLRHRQYTTRLLQIGIPDRFIEHGKPTELLAICQLDSDGITAQISQFLAQ